MTGYFLKLSKKNFCCMQYPNRIKVFKYLSAPVRTSIDEAKLPPPTKISKEEIEYLERVALVRFESDKTVQIVEESLRFADKIFEVNTDNVEPLTTVLENECLHLRDDIAKINISRTDLLSHTTKTIENYYVAPTGNVNNERKPTIGKSYSD